jgi:hypothetical protein
MNSKTLMAIISSPSDNEMVKRHWPYFLLTGFDIVGCGTVDGLCEWPEPVMRFDTGQLGKRITNGISAIWGLVPQEIEILKMFLTTRYETLVVVEADNVWVTRNPPSHPGGFIYLVNLMTNLHKGIFATPVYASTPRICDRTTAGHLVHWGEKMIASGDVEYWISDRFMMKAAFVGQIRFQHYPSWTSFPFDWSGMSVKEAFIKDARTAIHLGNHVLHGIKTQEQLNQITEGFNIL